jgi:hypothetical protein
MSVQVLTAPSPYKWHHIQLKNISTFWLLHLALLTYNKKPEILHHKILFLNVAFIDITVL